MNTLNDPKLIVNADDFGCNSSINHAIVESFSRNLVNSTTVMANMPGFDEAIELAHQHQFDNSIGVHLDLTDGRPITEGINSLDYLFSGNLDLKTRLRKLFYLSRSDKELIFNEYSAQIDRVLANKVNITHLDTHHQLHDMKAIMDVMISLLKKYNIPSMRILNNLEKPIGKSGACKSVYRNLINRTLVKRKINFSGFMGDQLSYISAASENRQKYSGEIVEIMVHPNFNAEGDLVDTIGNKHYDFHFFEERAV